MVSSIVPALPSGRGTRSLPRRFAAGRSKLGCVANTEAAAPYPWAPASATGVGSMPGTDPAEAMRIILGELPDLPHLAELPGRGAGADLTGRTAALLVEMPVELTPTGWRFAGRPGRDLRRARDLLSSDLDTLEEYAGGYTGPLKVQAAGPWTLAATIELTRTQERALTDRGAMADLTGSLGEGLRAHLDQIAKRVPGATILLQLDEPALPGVLAGALRSASGLRRLEPPEAHEAENRLAAVLAAAGVFSIVHCCALSVPFGIIRGAGADAVSFDLAQLGQGGEDALAETVEAGLGILAGAVPATPEPGRGQPGSGRAGRADGQDGGGRGAGGQRGRPETGGPAAAGPDGNSRGGGQAAARGTAERVIGLWRRMGWPAGGKPGLAAGPAGLPGQVVLTPACGLAGAPPGYPKDALARCRDAARLLPELIEEG